MGMEVLGQDQRDPWAGGEDTKTHPRHLYSPGRVQRVGLREIENSLTVAIFLPQLPLLLPLLPHLLPPTPLSLSCCPLSSPLSLPCLNCCISFLGLPCICLITNWTS